MGLLHDEPVSGIALFTHGTTGGREPVFIFHAGLTIFDGQGVLKAHLAQKVPTVEEGDWKVFQDGTMEVTWKLRPDVKWHDGTPLTAEDFVLGTELVLDPELPLARPRGAPYMLDSLALDKHTLLVRWKRTFTEANVSDPLDIPAAPRHLVADAYQSGEKAGLPNHPYWTREFVGLGSYRLGEWVLGSHIEAIAFDQYFLGRPKIDRVILRYFTDVNALTANLFSGDVDVIPAGSLKVEHAIAIRSQWEPVQGGTVMALKNKFRVFDLQYRDPTLPWARDLRVRQGMIHMLDRQAIVDALLAGLTTVADVPIPLEDPAFRLAEARGFARYPYGLARAERLLGDADWRRGPDGIYRSSEGDRFTAEVGATGSSMASAEAQEAQVLADQWRVAGIDTTFVLFHEDQANLREARTKVRGGTVRTIALVPVSMFRAFTTAEIASEANRWRGNNRGGYSNPTLDRLFGEFSGALEIPKRETLTVDLARLLADEALFIPLYYGFDVMAFRKGVRGLTSAPAVQRVTAWNIHAWELG